MKPARMVQIFTDKYPFVGPAFWIASVQYYVIQLLAASAWTSGYSLRFNTISDLGNSQCGVYAGRYICSPLYPVMNLSFLVLGLTMIIGSVLIYQEFRETEGSAIGFSAMAVAGFGTLLVGMFPENSINWLHVLGATLPFLIGNIGLVIFGLVLEMPKKLKNYSLLSGLISLVGLVLFSFHIYLGLGIGGMERITAYPQTIWLIVFGIYMSSNHLRQDVH
ncbi:MAG: DUF998 domain-containing protein [Candidatus Saccharimonadales bacterium]